MWAWPLPGHGPASVVEQDLAEGGELESGISAHGTVHHHTAGCMERETGTSHFVLCRDIVFLVEKLSSFGVSLIGFLLATVWMHPC